VYFAVDRADATLLARTLKEQMLTTSPPNLQRTAAHWFALVDGAFDDGRRSLSWHLPVTPIYNAAPLDKLKALSPYLAALPAPQEADFGKYVGQLVRHCNGRPMLSFIACAVDADELCEQWQRCLTLVPEGGDDPYLLRFADTRVLPALPTLPNQNLWRTLTETVTHWSVVHRTGALLELKIDAQDTQVQTDEAKDEFLEITDEDLSYLLKSGQADSVINAIEDQLPELLPERQRSQFHKRVEVACELADQHQVDAFPDVVALAVAGQLTDGGIYEDAALLKLLAERRWTSGQLNDALIEFLPEEAL
jgi:Domain of unknown function (DUF4123)